VKYVRIAEGQGQYSTRPLSRQSRSSDKYHVKFELSMPTRSSTSTWSIVVAGDRAREASRRPGLAENPIGNRRVMLKESRPRGALLVRNPTTT